jgi:hypothetical protein
VPSKSTFSKTALQEFFNLRKPVAQVRDYHLAANGKKIIRSVLDSSSKRIKAVGHVEVLSSSPSVLGVAVLLVKLVPICAAPSDRIGFPRFEIS